jgi:hypothetical protein
MTATFSEALTAEIRAEMARQNIRNPALATLSGINRTEIWRKVNDRRLLDSAEMKQIADGLGISLAELTARAEAALAAKNTPKEGEEQ